MLGGCVVECDLFARGDRWQGVEKDAAVRDATVAAGNAGVVDERRGAATAAGVDAPTVVDLADADLTATRGAGARLSRTNPLSKNSPSFLRAGSWTAVKHPLPLIGDRRTTRRSSSPRPLA